LETRAEIIPVCWLASWLRRFARHAGFNVFLIQPVKVLCGIHSIMQKANDRYAVRRDAKIDQMPLHSIAKINQTNVIAGLGLLGAAANSAKACTNSST
jgi:hypothetical protein